MNQFLMTKEEWDEMVLLMMRVTNGSTYMKKEISGVSV
jgi:hypothetical protein